MNSGRHRAGERDYITPKGKKLASSGRALSAEAGRVGAASISQCASLGIDNSTKNQEAVVLSNWVAPEMSP